MFQTVYVNNHIIIMFHYKTKVFMNVDPCSVLVHVSNLQKSANPQNCTRVWESARKLYSTTSSEWAASKPRTRALITDNTSSAAAAASSPLDKLLCSIVRESNSSYLTRVHGEKHGSSLACLYVSFRSFFPSFLFEL